MLPMAERELARALRERIYRECDASAIVAEGSERATHVIRSLAQAMIVEDRRMLPAGVIESILDDVVAATLGLGPIESLVLDPEVSEIMVNGCHSVWVERHGRLEQADVSFDDDEHVRQVIDRILAPIGRRLDALNPMVDARLPDGSRVNAVVPPLAVDGPAVTIRKFLNVARTLDDLVRLGTLDEGGRDLLEGIVRDHHNVIVAGATSSGKTTLLAAALAQCLPHERVLVIEDAAELPINHLHCVRLESRPPTFEAAGEVTLRDLVRNALRMRPDRLVIGEVRGGEAFDLIQALNTGHRGCWSTVHANGPHDALMRITSMAMTAGTGVPVDIVRENVARSIDTVIFLGRDAATGQRHLRSIHSVHDGEGAWQLEQLFRGR